MASMVSFPPARRETITTTDGVDLHAQCWAPSATPEATIVLVHGYAEHSGRYDEVAHAFTQERAAVHAYDQRGYGRSGGPRAYVDSFAQYLDDLEAVLDFVQQQTPERPLFLFGHSMGGLVVVRALQTRSLSPHGVILSAPALEVNPDLAPWLRQVSHVLGRLLPSLPTVRSPPGAISRDPAVVQEAENDPLNYHGRIRARTGAELLRAGREARARLEAVQTPFLVVHGTADVLANPHWSQQLHERALATDKTIRLYEGLYHETFNEPERDTVLDDLTNWLSTRMT